MRALQRDRLHEGRHVVREQLGRVFPLGLVALPRASQVDRDACEVLRVLPHLEGIAGLVAARKGISTSGSPEPCVS